MPRKPKPVPGSLAWEVLQLVHAVEVAHPQTPEGEAPLCPRCEKRPRVYFKGRLISYCLECKHAIDKERYDKVKKEVKKTWRIGDFSSEAKPRVYRENAAKICARCKKALAARNKRSGGYHGYCVPCMRAIQRERTARITKKGETK